MTRIGPSARRGSSLISLVALVGMGGVAFTLVLPGVAQVRDYARFTQCRNNLKALGLALHNYHDAFKKFPPGIVAPGSKDEEHQAHFVAGTPDCENPTMAQTSGLTLILPFVEAIPAYNAMNLHLACCSLQNATAVCKAVEVFVCPANTRGTKLIESTYYQTLSHQRDFLTGPAPTDYVFCVGAAGVLSGENPFVVSTTGVRTTPAQMRAAAGIFNVNSSVSIDMIKDGTSNTFMMGESSGGPNRMAGLTRRNDSPVDGTQEMTAASTVAFCDTPWSQGYIGGAANSKGTNNGGFGSVLAATAWNAWYEQTRAMAPADKWTVIPPNEAELKYFRPTWYASSKAPFNLKAEDGTAMPGDVGGIQGFRGFHDGGVFMLLADGSVKFVRNGVDAKVWAGCSTIAGRENVNPDDLEKQ